MDWSDLGRIRYRKKWQKSVVFRTPVDVCGKVMVPDAGIEPATFGLQNRCSTS
jgi:hypothetical protein